MLFGAGAGTWLGGAAIFGVLAASWAKIKWALSRISSLFIVRLQLERELARAIALYCWRRMRRSPFGSRRYSSFYEYVRPIHRNQVVAFETIGQDPIVFWRGIFPLLLGTHEKDVEEGQKASWGRKVVVTFIRGTFDMDKLVVEAINAFNESLRSNEHRSTRFYVEHIFGKLKMMYDPDKDKDAKEEVSTTKTVNHLALGDRRVLRWSLDDLGAEHQTNGAALGSMAFPAEVDQLVQEARYWLRSEKWYRDKGIPWKRGWLLYGKTGTGKTSLIRAVAQDLDLPVWVYDVASLSNEELLSAWRRMLTQIPCIALFEDLDNLFEGRRNVGGDISVMTFDALLNCIDGVEPSNGVLVAVTTNRVDKLDEALGVPKKGDTVSTRPGRIDRVVELKELDESCRRRLAERILSECPDRVDDLVEEGNGDTGAQFQDRCTQVAHAHYWTTRPATDEDEEQEKPVELASWNSEPMWNY